MIRLLWPVSSTGAGHNAFWLQDGTAFGPERVLARPVKVLRYALGISTHKAVAVITNSVCRVPNLGRIVALFWISTDVGVWSARDWL